MNKKFPLTIIILFLTCILFLINRANPSIYLDRASVSETLNHDKTSSIGILRVFEDGKLSYKKVMYTYSDPDNVSYWLNLSGHSKYCLTGFSPYWKYSGIYPEPIDVSVNDWWINFTGKPSEIYGIYWVASSYYEQRWIMNDFNVSEWKRIFLQGLYSSDQGMLILSYNFSEVGKEEVCIGMKLNLKIDSFVDCFLARVKSDGAISIGIKLKIVAPNYLWYQCVWTNSTEWQTLSIDLSHVSRSAYVEAVFILISDRFEDIYNGSTHYGFCDFISFAKKVPIDAVDILTYHDKGSETNIVYKGKHSEIINGSYILPFSNSIDYIGCALYGKYSINGIIFDHNYWIYRWFPKGNICISSNGTAFIDDVVLAISNLAHSGDDSAGILRSITCSGAIRVLNGLDNPLYNGKKMVIQLKNATRALATSKVNGKFNVTFNYNFEPGIYNITIGKIAKIFTVHTLSIRNLSINVSKISPDQYFQCKFDVGWVGNTSLLSDFTVELYINNSYFLTTNENILNLKMGEYADKPGTYLLKVVAVDTCDATYDYSISDAGEIISLVSTSSYDYRRSFLSVSFDITIFLVCLFPIGYLLMYIVDIEKNFSTSFLVKLPIYLATGMAGVVIYLSVMGFILINNFIIIFLYATTISVILYFKLACTRANKIKFMRRKVDVFHSFTLTNVMPLILLALTYLHFVRLARDMFWAPPGDCCTHGMVASLILANQRFPSTYFPIADLPFRVEIYPRGLQLLGAFVALLTKRYPGQSLLTIATCISMLMPLVFYSVTYIKTKSPTLGLISYLMTYLMPARARSSSDILMYHFLNGTYPAHLGNLMLIGLFSIVVLFDDFSFSLKFWSQPWFKLYCIIGLATIFSYYTYAFFVIIYPIVRFLIITCIQIHFYGLSRIEDIIIRLITSARTKLLRSIFIALGILSLSFTLYFAYARIMNVVDEVFTYTRNGIGFVDFYTLFSGVNGLLIFLSLCIILVSIAKCGVDPASIFYLCFMVPMLMATNKDIFVSHLWFFQPHRIIRPLSAFSYVVLPIFANRYLTTLNVSIKIYGKKILLNPLLGLITFVLIFTPILYTHLTFCPSTWGRVVGADFEALEYIVKNTKPTDLILNDRSCLGWFLTSFRPQRVVNERWVTLQVFGFHKANNETLENMILECNSIFDNPTNDTLIQKIIAKYKIKYIYISSSRSYLVYTYRAREKYEFRPWNQKEYLRIFDRKTYLNAVFIGRNVRVYKTFIEE